MVLYGQVCNIYYFNGAGAPLLVTLNILLQFKRFIASAVYYDGSDALFVEFTEEPEDIADEATDYLLVGYSDTEKIKYIRIDSPSTYVRGIASDKPTFSLKTAYDEKNDVFRFNLADPVSVTIQKTDIEGIELEIDDEGKLVTILILNASTRMTNMSQ